MNHQDSTLFATLFTYSSTGQPMWLVASSMPRQTDETFSGALYRVAGPAFDTSPWRGNVTATQVGGITLRFVNANEGILTYTMGPVSVTKTIQRQVFGVAPTCVLTNPSRTGATNYQDLWWNAMESGWGVNLTHQSNTIFATLFTYDRAGNDMWLVASSLAHQSDGSFTGPLYRTVGPAFNSQTWNAQNVMVTSVGTMTLRFSNGENATLSYTMNGTSITKSIQRQVFGVAAPLCR